MTPASIHRNKLIANVLLVDDDARFRQYLRLLLTNESSIDRVTDAADGHDAIRLIEELDLDLMLTDVVMPGPNGIAVTRRARAQQPDLKVIVVSMHDDKRMVEAAFEAGASGYLLKDHLDDELPEALAAVGRGETYLSLNLRKT